MALVLDGTNGVSGVDGTASNPSLEGTDSNTGVFFPAADTVAIATGGTEALRVNSSQQVGIGTTSPVARLNVRGGTTITSLADWNSKATSTFDLANPAVRFGIGYDASDQVLLQGFDTLNNARALGLQVYGGNVGVGTSSPNNIFEASRNQNAQTQIRVYNANSGSSAAAVFLLGNDSSAGAGGIYINSSNNTSFGAGANSLNIYQGLNASLGFMTNGVLRSTIDNAGNLMVNTTTAYGTITTTGTIAPAATPSASWGIDFASGTTPPNYVTLTAAATYDLATGSGFVIIHNNGTGEAGVFITYAGVVTKLGGAASIVSGTGGASQIGLVYNGGAGKYRINNGYATTQNIYIATIRTRTSS